MGRRGPKKTPSALTLAKGNPGKRAVNHQEPELPPADLTPPAGLKGVALEEWQTMGPMLLDSGVLTVADMRSFETYCQLWADVVRYTELAGKQTPEAAITLGYAGQLLKVRGQFKQYSEILGLTPTSRSGVKAKKPTDPADERRKRFFGIKGGQSGGTA